MNTDLLRLRWAGSASSQVPWLLTSIWGASGGVTARFSPEGVQKPRLLAREQDRSLPIPRWTRVRTVSTVPNGDSKREHTRLGERGCSPESPNSTRPSVTNSAYPSGCCHAPPVARSAAVSRKSQFFSLFFSFFFPPSWPGNREQLGIICLWKTKPVFRQRSFVQGLYVSTVHRLVRNVTLNGQKPGLGWRSLAGGIWSRPRVTERG